MKHKMELHPSTLQLVGILNDDWLVLVHVTIIVAMGYPDILEWFFNRKDGKSYVTLLDRNKRTPCHDAAEYG